MWHTLKRARSLMLRLQWLRPVAGSTLAALQLAARIRRDKLAWQNGSFNGTLVAFRGIDERALKEVLVEKEYSFLGPRLNAIEMPTIIDAGAHIGTFGLWALSANARSRIVSIEADPNTYKILQHNAEASGSNTWSVQHRAGADSSDQTLRFSTTGAAMSHRLSADGEVEVRTIDLAHLLNRISPDGASIDLLKVDIEGAEEAFLCAQPELLKRIDMLVVELHPGACDTDRVRRVLESFYPRIDTIAGRSSSKPLLFCQH